MWLNDPHICVKLQLVKRHGKRALFITIPRTPMQPFLT